MKWSADPCLWRNLVDEALFYVITIVVTVFIDVILA